MILNILLIAALVQPLARAIELEEAPGATPMTPVLNNTPYPAAYTADAVNQLKSEQRKELSPKARTSSPPAPPARPGHRAAVAPPKTRSVNRPRVKKTQPKKRAVVKKRR